jgi:hypothetical protein
MLHPSAEKSARRDAPASGAGFGVVQPSGQSADAVEQLLRKVFRRARR